MGAANTGLLVKKALEAFAEFGKITAQEFADYADIDRYAAHAVLNRMIKRTKAGEKRAYIAGWVHSHDGARRYPRAVFALGDKPDNLRPKPNIGENRRRSEAKRNAKFRMNSVFNMGLNRHSIRQILKSLHQPQEQA